MHWFNSLKLGTKLILAFLIVATIAGTIGFIGNHSVSQVNDLMTSMYKDRLLPIKDIGDIRAHAADNFRRLYELSTASDAKAIADAREKSRTAVKSSKKHGANMSPPNS